MRLWLSAILAMALAVPAFAAQRQAPLLSARAHFEIQKDADRLYGALAAIHARQKSGTAAQDLLPAKRALAADLRQTVAQLPGPAPAWEDLTARLQQLRGERQQLERAGSRPSAELSASIMALQMRAALAHLEGRTPLPSPALRRNAALWSLVGAYNSAAAGLAETGWREGVARADDLFGEDEAVIVSRRWRSAHAEIDGAARDARNGREAQAARRFSELARLLRSLPVEDAQHLRRHRDAARDLDAAAQASTRRSADVDALARQAKAQIPHPRLAEVAPVAYDSLEKAARAQAHALASIKQEYLAVLLRETSLSRWAAVLAGPRVAEADRLQARENLDEAQHWAGRGFVGPKQVAAQALAAGLTALDARDDRLAARHASWARDQLLARRAELERIAKGVIARLRRMAGLRA